MSLEDLLQLILLTATLIMTILGWHVSKLNKEDIVRLEDRLDTIRERSSFLFKRKVEIADVFLNCLDSGFESKIKLESLTIHNKNLKEKLELETNEVLKEALIRILDQNNNDIVEEITAISEWAGKFRFYRTRIWHFDEVNDSGFLTLTDDYVEKIRLFADVSYKGINNKEISNEITSYYYKIFKLITEKLEM